jgi:hypothetical protein
MDSYYGLYKIVISLDNVFQCRLTTVMDSYKRYVENISKREIVGVSMPPYDGDGFLRKKRRSLSILTIQVSMPPYGGDGFLQLLMRKRVATYCGFNTA